MSTDPDMPLWTPDQRSATASAVAGFARFVRGRLGVAVSDTDYSALHAWSVREIEAFGRLRWSTSRSASTTGLSAHWVLPTCPAGVVSWGNAQLRRARADS